MLRKLKKIIYKENFVVAILIALIFADLLGVGVLNTLAADKNIYCVDGDVCDYITGKGSYFNVERNFYKDESGGVAYCLESDKEGPSVSGTGGYKINESEFASGELYDKLVKIVRRGYPSAYIAYKTEDFDSYETKRGLFIDGIFYECDEMEARAVTSFAIHKMVYDYDVINGTVDEECVIESFENGPLAKHNLVDICNAMLDFSKVENGAPSIEIQWGKYMDGQFHELSDEALVLENQNRNGSIEVWAKVTGENCYIDNIYISDELQGRYVNIEECLFASDSLIYVKLKIDDSYCDKRFYGIKSTGKAFSSEIQILGNEKYQDILIAPNSYEISSESGGEVNTGRASIYKYDSYTKNPLAGVTFGIYTDVDCDLLVGKVLTDEFGIAELIDYPEGKYFFKELECPKGYILDETVHELDVFIGKDSFYEVYNDQYKLNIEIEKQDSVNGNKPLGDACFEGAIYGVFSKSKIYLDMYEEELVFDKDEKVCEVVLDSSGKGVAQGLLLGEYYVKELKAPKGYKLSQEVYDVCVNDKTIYNSKDGSALTKVIVKDDVETQPFAISKYYVDDSNDKLPLSGAGFSACLVSELEVDEEGKPVFDLNKAVIIAGKDEKIMFTDNEGYAESIAIPYGSYLIRETIVPKGFKSVEDFIIEINEEKASAKEVIEVEDKKEEDEEFHGEQHEEEKVCKVLFEKRDFDTKKYVAGAKLEVLDEQNNVVTTWISSAEAHTVDNLKIGNKYRLHEVAAPFGYILADDIWFTAGVEVKDNNVNVEEKQETQVVVMYDERPKGKIHVVKLGDMIKENLALEKELGTTTDCDNENDFLNKDEYIPLEGVCFELYAAEDIVSYDVDRTVVYKAGEKLNDGVTDEKGELEFVNLDIGKYYLKETKTNRRYVLNDEKISISIDYKDSKTKELFASSTVYNHLLNSSIILKKIDGDSKEALSGVGFGVFADGDVYDNDILVYKKGDLVFMGKTNLDGVLEIRDISIPGNYYIKETENLEGYNENENNYYFAIEESKDFNLEVLVENYKKTIDSSTSEEVKVKETEKKETITIKDENVKTGDETKIVTTVVVMIVSLLTLIFLRKNCRKN